MNEKRANPTDKYVGSRVRFRRKMIGFSQEKLAKALGLTFQQVQKYEKGTNRIGASRLQQMSDILDVPVTFFFDGAPRQTEGRRSSGLPAPDVVSEFMGSTEGIIIAKAFAKIKDQKLRRSIARLVEAIATE